MITYTIDVSYWPFILLFIPIWIILWANKVSYDKVLIGNRSIHLVFIVKWYDFWIGLFRDRDRGCNYIFFWPMFGFALTIYKHTITKEKIERFKKALKEDKPVVIVTDFKGHEQSILDLDSAEAHMGQMISSGRLSSIKQPPVERKPSRKKSPDGKCCCDMMASGGDMSPRIWWCERHGGTGFVGPMAILNELATRYPLSRDECWEAMHDFLEFKREEQKRQGGIYFCEDHFERDASKEFLNNGTSKYISKRL